MNKKISKFKVVIDIVLIISLIGMLTIVITACISLYKHQGNPIEANVFGYRLQYIKTDSMVPTIAQNSLILSKRVDIDSFDESNLNTVYTYYITDRTTGEIRTVTHKIVEVESNQIALTKGDGNDMIDDYILSPDQIIYEMVTPLNFTAKFHDIYSFYEVQLSQNPIINAFLYVVLPLIVFAVLIILLVMLVKLKNKNKNANKNKNEFDSNQSNELIEQIDKQWQQEYKAVDAQLQVLPVENLSNIALSQVKPAHGLTDRTDTNGPIKQQPTQDISQLDEQVGTNAKNVIVENDNAEVEVEALIAPIQQIETRLEETNAQPINQVAEDYELVVEPAIQVNEEQAQTPTSQPLQNVVEQEPKPVEAAKSEVVVNSADTNVLENEELKSTIISRDIDTQIDVQSEDSENIDDILAELNEICKEAPISTSNPHGMPR